MASWFLVEKLIHHLSKLGIRFRVSTFLFFTLLDARRGWKLWSDTGLPWYLSGAASRMVSLSNYCVWCLFFISNLMKSSAVYAAMYFMHVCKIWHNLIWPRIRFDIILQYFKKPLDIFSPQIEKKLSKEHLVIILAVKESFERFSCLEFIFEKSKYIGKPA